METLRSLKEKIIALKKEIEELKSDGMSIRFSLEEQNDYQESQIRFRTVFETSRLGNKIIGRDLKIIELNPAMLALLGYDKKEDLIGTQILDYVPPEYHNDWKTLQIKLWELRTSSFSLETCLKKKDGSIIWCNVTSILFQDHGKTLGYTIIEDISEQHKLKKHKDDFISIASHELKTPLTSLQGILQLINRNIQNDSTASDKLKLLSGKAENYTVKLNRLINDLLSATKIKKGQLTLEISRFKIAGLIENCCEHIRLQGKYQLIYNGDPLLEISADEYKIDQVLANLINNAVKYASESLEVIVKVEEFDDMIKVSVIDRGNGISADKLPYIFDAYYQANKGGNVEAGMGLGLYISSEIIKQHGGEMGVSSKIGDGSSFWFTIPKINNSSDVN